MASFNNKTLDMQVVKDGQKGRKKSGVPNWLKKHTKWARRNHSSNPNFDRGSTSSGTVATLPDQSENRKESIWKKGLSYVRSPKASLSKEVTSTSVEPSNFPNASCPFSSLYNGQQHPSLFHLALLSAPHMLMNLSFGQDPQASFFAANLEQAYIQHYRERMAYFEQLRAQQMVINFQQAAVVAEQTRAASAILEQAYLANGGNPLIEFPNNEIADTLTNSIAQEMEVDAQENEASPRRLHREEFRAYHDVTMGEVCDSNEVPGYTNEMFEGMKAAPFQALQRSSEAVSENRSPAQTNAVDSTIIDHNLSPERLQQVVPFSTNSPSLDMSERKNKATVEGNQLLTSGENTALHPNTSSSSSKEQQKRLKRNAISAEPSSYNEAVVGSSLFSKVMCFTIPKSSK